MRNYPKKTTAILAVAIALGVLQATSSGVAPVGVAKTAVLAGVKLVVRYGDNVVAHIDDVTKVSGSVLREALDDVVDVGVYAKVAKSRFPAVVSEKSVARLESVADDLARIPGAEDVLRLLVANDAANVKGAMGELELAAFLLRRKGVVVSAMRESAETAIGRTDIDIAFSYKGVPVVLERKAINGLGLNDEIRVKIDKMKEIADARNAVPVLSVGEVPPSSGLIEYAEARGVLVTHGGYLKQVHSVQAALDALSVGVP